MRDQRSITVIVISVVVVVSLAVMVYLGRKIINPPQHKEYYYP